MQAPQLAVIYFTLKLFIILLLPRNTAGENICLLLVENLDFNATGLHHILRQLIWIRIGVNNAFNACVNKDFGTHYAGLVGAI